VNILKQELISHLQIYGNSVYGTIDAIKHVIEHPVVEIEQCIEGLVKEGSVVKITAGMCVFYDVLPRKA